MAEDQLAAFSIAFAGHIQVGHDNQAGSTRSPQESDLGLENADSEMRVEDGLLCRLAGARVSFRSSFCAVAGLLQLDHRIARRGFASRLPIRLVRLAVELPDHRDKHHRRASIAFHGLPCAHRF